MRSTVLASRRLRAAAFLGAMAVLAALPAPAEALPNARWRCKMTGDIPLGTLTVSGSTYQFVVARTSTWDPKPGDSGNGSGELRESGNTVTPISGPLATVYNVVGQTSKATDGSVYIAFASRSGTPFACWQG